MSYEREPEDNKGGDIMNPTFLKTLYEQYIRLHFEMLTKRRSSWYACLDFSQGSMQENAQLLNSTLHQCFQFQTPGVE